MSLPRFTSALPDHNVVRLFFHVDSSFTDLALHVRLLCQLRTRFFVLCRYVHECPGYLMICGSTHTFADLLPSFPTTYTLCCYAIVTRMSEVTTTTPRSWQITLSQPPSPPPRVPTLPSFAWVLDLCMLRPITIPHHHISSQYIPFLFLFIPYLLSPSLDCIVNTPKNVF